MTDGHEEKCLKCGKCCYMKTFFNGKAYFTDEHCKYLDPRTNLCTIYEKRYKVIDGCIPFSQAIINCCFPSDCPYVKDIPGYMAPLSSDELRKTIKEHLK